MQTLQFYSKLYYDTRIKATVDAEWPKIVAQAGAKGAPPPKRLKHQNTVVARKFAAETAEFQVALKRQRDAEFEEEYAAWKACSLDSMDVPKTAEEYALYVRAMPSIFHRLAHTSSPFCSRVTERWKRLQAGSTPWQSRSQSALD